MVQETVHVSQAKLVNWRRLISSASAGVPIDRENQ